MPYWVGLCYSFLTLLLQVDDVVLETRARVFQKQQNRLQNRPLPSQGRSGFVDGGFPRVSGGTGVFHPRVLNTANIAPNTTTTSSPSFVKKKQGEFLFIHCFGFNLVDGF